MTPSVWCLFLIGVCLATMKYGVICLLINVRSSPCGCVHAERSFIGIWNLQPDVIEYTEALARKDGS
jgi:fumarate reductase subunit D